jgi:NNP family nitrate/nitrite transporter-like MFS transporter
MNTAAFTVNFMVWTMFSIIGIKIKGELGLNETEFGLLVATPILTGSLVRLPLGLLTDRFGGRIVYFIQMILVAISTYGLAFANEYWQYLAIGLCVGLAGGSFAIGIAYTSAWFPKHRQGTALGIFGAGNAGAAVTNLAAPLIVVALGWRALMEPRVWRYGLAYYFVFGGFVALSLWLPKYYMAEYGLALTSAAFISLFFTLPSGVIRALGGWFSDKWGGDTVTWWVFWICIVCLFFLSFPPTTLAIHGIGGDATFDIGIGVVFFTILVFIVGIAQGIGKASVYKSLADHYSGNMGAVGGLVGVIGGLGGFSLPIMFGIAADATEVRSSTFMLMFLVLAGVMIWTWTSARREREEVLERAPSLREQLVKEELVSVVAARRRWLKDWRPDDPEFWRMGGRRVAVRNLFFSMPPLLLSFAVWMVWSVVVVELPKIGFAFTTGELFWLAAAPGISGAALRLLYSFVVPIFGGRNFTVFSTASLLIPTLWMAMAVQDPGTDYFVFVVIALLCGLGGGNFSASMANISFFFPKRMQGTALGWNAGVGNLGVGIMQAVVPLTIYGGALAVLGGDSQTHVDRGVVSQVWLQNAGYIWVPLILIATFAAAWGQNNIRGVRATFAEQVVIFRRMHAWRLGWLYTGTFGTFIGLAAAFPILLYTLYPDSGLAKWAFVGPLLGAVVRPLGGWLSDRLGGARVTLWTFAVMVVAAVGTLVFLPSGSGIDEANWFFAACMAEGKDKAAQDAAKSEGEIEASVALGFTAAVAALGLFLIPALIAVSISVTGTPGAALIAFIVFCVTCLLGTWWWYRRRGAEVRCD